MYVFVDTCGSITDTVILICTSTITQYDIPKPFVLSKENLIPYFNAALKSQHRKNID